MIISIHNPKTREVLRVSAAYAQKDSNKYFSMYLYKSEDVSRIIHFLQLKEHEYSCRRMTLTIKEDTLTNVTILMK